MSDLDKFVLSYVVELKDSIQRLEKLHEKMDKVEAKSTKAGGELKEFAKGAAGELDRLIPGLNSVAGAIGKMGGAFAIAATAVGALGAGISSVLALREQMNKQRSDSLFTGLSGARIEDMTRKLSREGGGYVSREQASEGMRALMELSQGSYRNPSDWQARKKLADLGINPGAYGNGPMTAPLDVLQQLAQRTQGMDDAHLQGLARESGLNIDWIRSIAKVGPGGVTNIGMSEAEVNAYNNGQDNVSKLNTEMQEFRNQVNQLEMSLGEGLIPNMNGFLKFVNGLVEQITHTTDKAHPEKRWKDVVTPEGQVIQVEDTSPAPETQQLKEDKKKEQQKANDAAKKQDDAAAQGVRTQNDFAAAIQAFSGAVSNFSNAIDMNRAVAAWAGEIGKAAGLTGATGTGPVTLTGGGRGDWKSSPYAPQIAAAAAAYGVDPQMLHALVQTESHGKNGQYSPTGAGGLMQITRGNWKAYGNGRDIMDPAANIAVGARIWKESLARAHGDIAQAARLYNGDSDPKYVEKLSKNYGGSTVGTGQSKAALLQNTVFRSLASSLGISPEQALRHGYSTGDARNAVLNAEGSAINGLSQLQLSYQAQLKNPMFPPAVREATEAQIKQQMIALQSLRDNAQAFIQNGFDGRATRTRIDPGAMPTAINATINITGAPGMDTHALAAKVREEMLKMLEEANATLKTAAKS